MFKCLKIFIYTPNICVQDRETVFTKTFKTYANFVWIEVFDVKRKNITIKINIWIAFKIKKIIIHLKGLYETNSKFAPEAILVFHGISFEKIPKNFD